LPSAHADSLPGQLQACASITEPRSRLECFDALAAEQGRSAEAAGDVVASPSIAVVSSAVSTVPPTTPATAAAGLSRQETFGKEQTLLAKSVSGEDALREISATVLTVRSTRDGRLAIDLDNGQLWIQTETPTQPFDLSAGDRVTIRRGALNSFQLAAPDRRSTRVRRSR